MPCLFVDGFLSLFIYIEFFLESTRIIPTTYVVLGTSNSTKLPPKHSGAATSPVNQDNMADALTLGDKRAEKFMLDGAK